MKIHAHLSGRQPAARSWRSLPAPAPNVRSLNPVAHCPGGEKPSKLYRYSLLRDTTVEGVGQRATERLLGVSHNSITNWVKMAVGGQVLKATPAEKVAWVEADELWTYVSKTKMMAGSGGLLIVLPSASWAGRWGIVEPKPQSGWMRSFLTPPH